MGNITSKNYEITDQERSLIELKKVRLINFLPRHAKKSAEIMVNVKAASKGAKKITAEIIINVPSSKELVAHASADSLNSAYEVAENKIKAQIRKYKDERGIKNGFLRKVLKRKND